MIKKGALEISGGFLLVAALLFYLDTENLLPWTALACGLHELGHYVAVRLSGGKILRFRLTAVGGELTLDQSKPLSYARELLSIFAGPGMNLAAAFLSAHLARGEAAWVFTGLNLSLGLFNLLPVVPLDGGRMLTLLLGLFCREETVVEVMRVCSILIIAALLLTGGALFFQAAENFTLAIVAIWLMAGLLRRPGQKRGHSH